MTKRASRPKAAKPALLVFGLDENSKPKGRGSSPASSTRHLAGLHICEALSEELVELSKKLPREEPTLAVERSFRLSGAIFSTNCLRHSMTGGSPNPADPSVTARVFTLMLT